jgi:hypothetical protein
MDFVVVDVVWSIVLIVISLFLLLFIAVCVVGESREGGCLPETPPSDNLPPKQVYFSPPR